MSVSKLAEIGGVLPALVTPFDENEVFDEGRMRSIVDFLIGRGVDGLYVTGSTGEAFMMSPEERKRVLEVVTDEVKGRVPVMAHVGAISTLLILPGTLKRLASMPFPPFRRFTGASRRIRSSRIIPT